MRILIRPILIFIFAYLLGIGATWNGVLNPGWHTLTLAVLVCLLPGWVLLRGRSGWQWHQTPLDIPFLVWGAAFLLAWIANPEMGRRIIIGGWYMLLYIGIWYALQDLFANRFNKDIFIDALLFSGVLALAFGLINIAVVWDTTGEIARPVSLLGNTNAFAAYLIGIIPFALYRFTTARHALARWLMGGYALLASLLLIMTFSRGGWLGFGAAVVTFSGLMLHRADMLSPAKLRQWFSAQNSRIKAGISAVLLLLIAAAVFGTGWIINSLSVSGRDLSLRTYLWDSAINQFLEKPLTGQGLFTFGYDLGLCQCMPPRNPQSHAHSLPLQIAAELGVVGIAAFVISVGVLLVMMRRNWNQTSKRQQPQLAAAIAVVAGFSVHQLVDTPIMMPLIALVGWLAVNLALAAVEPQPLRSTWRRRGHPLGMAGLWLLLLVSGAWSSHLHQRYFSILQSAAQTQNYIESAEALTPIIEADPQQAPYIMGQAYLYGLAAASGDDDAAAQAITAYNRLLELEPYHAVSWANKAALHWQLNQTDAAIAAIEQAIFYAPEYDLFQRNAQIYTGNAFDEADYEWRSYTFAPNMTRFQYLRDSSTQPFLPQVGAE